MPRLRPGIHKRPPPHCRPAGCNPAPRSLYWSSTLREPLLAPLAAIAAGIVVSRFVVFESRELLFAIAAFLILGVLSLKRRSRPLALVCALLALTAAGALTDVLHRPGPPPEIDTGSRATLIV